MHFCVFKTPNEKMLIVRKKQLWLSCLAKKKGSSRAPALQMYIKMAFQLVNCGFVQSAISLKCEI